MKATSTSVGSKKHSCKKINYSKSENTKFSEVIEKKEEKGRDDIGTNLYKRQRDLPIYGGSRIS